MPKGFLVQGGSIADCARDRKDFYRRGNGYANMVKDSLGTDFPTEYEFINRGVSADRSVDIYARIKIDFAGLRQHFYGCQRRLVRVHLPKRRGHGNSMLIKEIQQPAFDAASPAYWAYDGVHPAPAAMS